MVTLSMPNRSEIFLPRGCQMIGLKSLKMVIVLSPTNACKVCHTGVIGHEDAAGLEKFLYISQILYNQFVRNGQIQA